LGKEDRSPGKILWYKDFLKAIRKNGLGMNPSECSRPSYLYWAIKMRLAGVSPSYIEFKYVEEV
jgi:hypothetical protein